MSLESKLKDFFGDEVTLLDFGNEIQLAGAIYVGKGMNCLVVLPDEELVPPEHPTDTTDVPNRVLKLDREEWIEFLRQTDLQNVEVAAQGEDGTFRKAIVRKTQRQIDQNVAWRAYRRDGMRCRYCGDDKVPLTVDHLVCWEEGGPTTLGNVLSSCRVCNRVRGRTPYDRWILEHRHYRESSKKLPFAVREDNEALIETLAAIPRVPVRSR